MAKGKRASGKHYTSKGEVPTVNKKVKNAIRSDYLQSQERFVNQMRALHKGKDVVLTVPNPNKQETNKRMIKVKVSGREFLKRMTG